MKEKVVRGERNPTFAIGSAFGFSRQRASGNILARAVSLFRASCVSSKLRRKRHNAVTPFATIRAYMQIEGAGAGKPCLRE